MRERRSTRLSTEMTEQTEQSEVDTENLPEVAADDDDVFDDATAAIKEEEEEGSGGSGGDEKSPSPRPSVARSSGTKEAEEPKPEAAIMKKTFGGFAAKMAAQKPKEDSRPSTPKRKEALLQQYYALMKEKRELRKRNAQAQTNICQYLRKHNIDLFSHMGADKSQV